MCLFSAEIGDSCAQPRWQPKDVWVARDPFGATPGTGPKNSAWICLPGQRRLVTQELVGCTLVTQESSKPCPQLVPGVDIMKLAIGPEEAFVLSRVDGHSDHQAISFATGLDAARVESALCRLAEVGAITYASLSHGAKQEPPAAGRGSEDMGRPRQAPLDLLKGDDRQTAAGFLSSHDAAISVLCDPAELEGDFDLSIERRRLVLGIFNQLDSIDHYQALGLQRDADRKAIKDAYFELVATIHPDKYYGKNIGHFREKMEKCFARVTEAYNVLSRQATRQEYDTYLRAQQEAADLQRALDMRVTADDLDRLELELMRIAEASSSAPPDSSNGETPVAKSPSAPKHNFRVLTERERRQALANTLRRTSPGFRLSVTPEPNASSATPESTERSEGLKVLYESRLQRARQTQLLAHTQAAKEALERNDPVAACNSLKLAQQLANRDPAVLMHLSTMQNEANGILAGRFLEQAQYEERHGNMEAAGRSYARAADARPSVELWERAARCAKAANTDLRFAAESAKKAAELDPARLDLHLLLAEIYLDAQLKASASAVVERALRLAPNDDRLKELRRRLDRGGN